MTGLETAFQGFEDFGNDALNGLGDFGALTSDLFSGAGTDIANWTVDAGNDIAGWTIGAGNDIADWTVGAGGDIADWTVGAGNAFIGGLDDAWNWVSDGDNWEALGKTLGTSALLAVTGNFEEAGSLLTNEDLYTGEGYDEIERRKEEYER